MKRVIRWIARLYPAAWRERYAVELNALIEDMQPKWRDLFNVLWGALRMQIAMRDSLRMMAFTGLAGVLVAGACACLTHDRFVSTAVVRFTFEGLADPDRQGTLVRLTHMQQKILSRKYLADLLARPDLDLYSEDRLRMPLEDVVAEMQQGLHVTMLRTHDWRVATFQISCMYPDKFKAQSVVRELVAKFVEQMSTAQRSQAPPAAVTLQQLDPANLPNGPYYPNRLVMVAVGLAGGAMLGFVAALARRWTHKHA